MFPWGIHGWAWGWGWVALIGFIILLGVFLLPWFFFLLNLQTMLNRVSDRNRAMPAGQVWLNFIPVFNLGWFIYTVTRVRDSLRAEYRSRGWLDEGDFGYNVGLAAGILAIVSFFLGWVPVIGWGLAIAELVCWIVYWLKTAEFKNRLGGRGWYGAIPPYGYQGPAAPPPGPGPMGPPSGPRPPGPGPAPYQSPPSAWTPTAPPPYQPAPPARTAPPGLQAAGGEGSISAESAREQCAACGTEFDPSDRFCRTCGLPLPQDTK